MYPNMNFNKRQAEIKPETVVLVRVVFVNSSWVTVVGISSNVGLFAESFHTLDVVLHGSAVGDLSGTTSRKPASLAISHALAVTPIYNTVMQTFESPFQSNNNKKKKHGSCCRSQIIMKSYLLPWHIRAVFAGWRQCFTKLWNVYKSFVLNGISNWQSHDFS